MHGWLILDKPLGLGSTQGVAAVKRALRDGGYSKVKVGHGGTLDPLATGVLPIALGEATKLAGRLLDGDKVYEFTVGFGEETDTLDLEGRVIASSDVRPTVVQVAAVLPRFTGLIEQVPPAYSALKVDGERAYDLARAGEEVVLASRSVRVHSLLRHPGVEPGSVSLPERTSAAPWIPAQGRDDGVKQVTLTAHVSKGTYIRSLARDIAHALGTVGHVTHLRRTRAGPFDLSRAISLDKLSEAGKARTLEHHLLPLGAGLDDIPALSLTPDQAGALRQGRVLAGIDAADGVTLATLDDVPQALVEIVGGAVRVVRGFNL
ncbi:MAG: tRNA pseudouridine(55) synthase TruB [Sphingomonas bacterium]|uniref:tRNA pseudouridine(55) synthase TruB n=1 Tax=Sphingomonas bacterium TaxID=1895847 RepID=UPI00260883FA|nr:tRNA pseudouridine(55) synthase TruB [Sphingomonas bacterium]MDB5694764.1 tRNA pseudouridine(55) synthase TruB [Sphingomonas bacterium]